MLTKLEQSCKRNPFFTGFIAGCFFVHFGLHHMTADIAENLYEKAVDFLEDL